MYILPIGPSVPRRYAIRADYAIATGHPPRAYLYSGNGDRAPRLVPLRNLLPLRQLQRLGLTVIGYPLNQQALVAALGYSGPCPLGLPCADDHPLPAILTPWSLHRRLNPDPDSPGPDALDPPELLDLQWRTDKPTSSPTPQSPTVYPPSIVIVPGSLIETLV